MSDIHHVDVLIVDSAHGHSKNVIETAREIKSRWDIDVVAGEIEAQEPDQNRQRDHH